MKLPKAIKTANIGDIAVSTLQNIFERHGWKFRRQDGATDYGVDAEIELVDGNFVTGKLLKIQIKGTHAINWRADGGDIPDKYDEGPTKVWEEGREFIPQTLRQIISPVFQEPLRRISFH